MRVRVGTSGYQYKFWRGRFYPADCKESAMLSEFARRLPTVEINNTFYRMPKREVVERWASQVPDEFRFALKASRRITHIKRLREAGEDVRYLFEVAQALGEKLYAVLFQLPPNLKQDLARLDRLLESLPRGARAALEFRHESWFEEPVYERLRARDVSLCISDEGEGERATPFIATASFGYLRLRRERYTDAELAELAGRVQAERWSEACIYFKHEEDAPDLAASLQRAFSG